MKKYIILRKKDIKSLEKEVCLFIEEGYIPLGGVAQLTHLPGGYMQAIILKEGENKNV